MHWQPTGAETFSKTVKGLCRPYTVESEVLNSGKQKLAFHLIDPPQNNTGVSAPVGMCGPEIDELGKIGRRTHNKLNMSLLLLRDLQIRLKFMDLCEMFPRIKRIY